MISKILGPRALLVEKNNHLFNILNSCSIYHHIQVDRIQDIADIPLAISQKYALLIIDINLAKENNALVIKQVRRNNPLLPIIAIGPDNPNQEIISCNLDINIYHHKPIRCELLKAQIIQLASIFHKNVILEIGNIKIDLVNKSFFVNNKKVIFTYQEFHLILLLLKSVGNTLDRDKICNCFAGSHKDISYAAIDTLVSRIRSKLKDSLNEPFIKTEYKLGYRLNPIYLKDYRIEKV